MTEVIGRIANALVAGTSKMEDSSIYVLIYRNLPIAPVLIFSKVYILFLVLDIKFSHKDNYHYPMLLGAAPVCFFERAVIRAKRVFHITNTYRGNCQNLTFLEAFVKGGETPLYAFMQISQSDGSCAGGHCPVDSSTFAFRARMTQGRPPVNSPQSVSSAIVVFMIL